MCGGTEKFVFCQDTASYFCVLLPQPMTNDFFVASENRFQRQRRKETKQELQHTHCKSSNMKIPEICVKHGIIICNQDKHDNNDIKQLTVMLCFKTKGALFMIRA